MVAHQSRSISAAWYIAAAAMMVAHQSSASITATFDRVQPERVQRMSTSFLKEPIQAASGSFKHVFQAHPDSVGVIGFAKNGLLGSMVESYKRHHHLELRPDDVWLGIMTGLDALMNRGPRGGRPIAEAVRSKLVNHTGQISLKAYGAGSIRTFDMESLVSQIAPQIDELSRPGFAEWVQPNFTTTTPLDRLVGRMTLMSTMQSFFKYDFVLLCGLPGVTLHGTPGDWRRLRDKAGMLLELTHPSITAWHDQLVPVLDKMVDTADGSADEAWWQQIAHVSGGSGPHYLTGWANVFAPADVTAVDDQHVDGVWGDLESRIAAIRQWGIVDTDSIPSGSVSVPIKVNDNGTPYDTHLLAGFVGARTTREGTGLAPALGWRLVGDKEYGGIDGARAGEGPHVRWAVDDRATAP